MLGLIVGLIPVACAPPESAPGGGSPSAVGLSGRILTLGDVDPDTPTERVRRMQPLADHLAAGLTEHGISGGRVVIARNLREMAELMRDGKVDVYFDSAFPAVSVRRLAGSRIVLQGAILGVFEYAGVLVARKGEGIDGLEDLVGRVVAFEEPHSTTGFLLPFAAFAEKGLDLVERRYPRDRVDEDRVGYYFSGDEENSVALVLDGVVTAAALSTEDWNELPPEYRDELELISQTRTLPRQLVSVRSDLPEAVEAPLREELLALGGARLEEDSGAWSWDFRPLTPKAEAELARIESLAEEILSPANDNEGRLP